MESYIETFQNLDNNFVLDPEFDLKFRLKLKSFVLWYEQLTSATFLREICFEQHSVIELRMFFEKFVQIHNNAKSMQKVVISIRNILALYAAQCVCCLCQYQSSSFECHLSLRKTRDDPVRNFAHLFHRLLVKLKTDSDSQSKFDFLDTRFKAHLSNWINWIIKKANLNSKFCPANSIEVTDQHVRQILNSLAPLHYNYFYPVTHLLRKIFDYYYDNCYCAQCCPERQNLSMYFVNTRSRCIQKQ